MRNPIQNTVSLKKSRTHQSLLEKRGEQKMMSVDRSAYSVAWFSFLYLSKAKAYCSAPGHWEF